MLRDHAEVCDPKVFADFLKEWQENDSNETIRNECIRRSGFLDSDETLECFFKHPGFKDKILERTLTTDVVAKLLDEDPGFKDKVSRLLMTTEGIGHFFNQMPLKKLSKFIALGTDILSRKLDGETQSENN